MLCRESEGCGSAADMGMDLLNSIIRSLMAMGMPASPWRHLCQTHSTWTMTRTSRLAANSPFQKCRFVKALECIASALNRCP